MHADEIAIPALLRAARGAYGNAVRRELVAAGFEDLPRNGPYVLGGMANRGIAAGDLVRQLGVSKQAASQLVDVLVLRGYLERRENADDRRKLDILLTDRGRAAAAAVRAGVVSVDEALGRRLSATDMAGLRAGLVALTEIREEDEATSRSGARPG